MKRVLAIFAALQLAAMPLLAAFSWTSTNMRYSSGSSGISVSSANTVVVIVDNRTGGSGVNFGATTVSVTNRSGSANTCAVNFEQTTAVNATDVPVPVGVTVIVTRPVSQAIYGIGVICASVQTAVFDVIAQ
jgi:hypothetical protein